MFLKNKSSKMILDERFSNWMGWLWVQSLDQIVKNIIYILVPWKREATPESINWYKIFSVMDRGIRIVYLLNTPMDWNGSFEIPRGL